MEIYKEDLDSPSSKEFERLLNSNYNKNKIEEGKIYLAEITKVSDKYIWCYLDGLKSESLIDINSLKSIGMHEKAKVGEKISVLVEAIEHPKTSEVVLSAEKAFKRKGWDTLVKAYEKKELIDVRPVSRCKGGIICEHVSTKTLTFMPGSQISDKIQKDISHLMGETFKAEIIKMDMIRGNVVTSRRAVLTSGKKEDKAKLLASFKVGQKVMGECKGFTSYGAFFSINNGELDTLVHLMEISYSRISHPEDVLNIGDKRELLIIDIDHQQLRLSTSIRRLSQDPFDKISEYSVGGKYKCKVIKIVDYGAFCELAAGLTCLLHASQISYDKKPPSPKKVLKVGMELDIVITNIEVDKRRVSVSHKLTKESPYKVMMDKKPVGSLVDIEISNLNEYSIFGIVDDLKVECFLHKNDLHYLNDPDEELKKFKKGQKLTVKVLEILPEESKIRVGLKQANSKDPYDWFKSNNIKEKSIITCKVISVDKNFLIVQPEGSQLNNLYIKKKNISLNPLDARTSRWNAGDRLDCAVSELKITNSVKKIALSIKLLEQMQYDEHIAKNQDPLSGRALPFASLSDKMLEKKDKKKEKK